MTDVIGLNEEESQAPLNSTLVLPSGYCGNIEYFYCLLNTDLAVIDVHETFSKQTFRSRCNILNSNGLLKLSVPVERPSGRETLMKDILISNLEDWRKDHLKGIESAYGRTPYFEYYIEPLREIISKNHRRLLELNMELTHFFIEKLGFSVKTAYSRNKTSIEGDDLRVKLSPKHNSGFNTKRYVQPFEDRHGFIGNLSILDLLFNEGNNSINIIKESSY